MYPKELRYTRDHEWVLLKDGTALIGITEFAAKQLGDIVFVELPEVGKKFDAAEAFGTVESVKAVTEVFSPISGTVTEINQDLSEDPEDLNTDPHASWIIKIKVANPKEADSLLTAEQYEAYIKEGEA
ncbi:glycine cleavage system protein GcvH [Chitinophaga flava]|uniref:Glycine cleavage system H protein n=1 Tax=Chitinophaga flava TaxID=2259036 RepID=A0A365XV80_9BACT|nr:glycine cleavage system protein GcvH [Chitinophaga flava]RBL89495.1 glycine cleavage system protein GcvH [Chitinophaga flava]